MTNRCPHCKEYIPAGTKYCTECGNKLPLWYRGVDVYLQTFIRLADAIYYSVRWSWLGLTLAELAVLGYTMVMSIPCIALIALFRTPIEYAGVPGYIACLIFCVSLIVCWPLFVSRKVHQLEQRNLS